MDFLLSLLCSLGLSAVFLLLLRQLRCRVLRLPPGSLGLPFIGETLQLISAYKSDNPEPFIDRRVKRYGAIFTTHVFGEPTVFSADPEMNRFILLNEGKLFDCSYPGSISSLLGKHSLLLMKGSLHKRMHSFTMSFANSAIIKEHLLVDIDRLIRLNLDSWKDRVFLMEEAKKITFELTVKQLMSLDPGEWSEGLRKEYVLVIEGFFTLPVRLLSTTYRRAIKARTKVAEALAVVVRQRRRQTETGQKMMNDMLGALLASGDRFSDDQIVDFMLALLIAGYETTSTIITLAVKFLTDTPLALAELKAECSETCSQKACVRILDTFFTALNSLASHHMHWPLSDEDVVISLAEDEHDQIRAKKSDPEAALEWTDYKSMAFTQCVVHETLRVGNIISGIFRRAMTDVNVRGYTIPKGWRLFASFRAVHLNSQHFKDARSFNPWRWQSNWEAGGGSPGNVYTPFGGGPRMCPGFELARVVVSVFLHRFVTQFSWAVAEEDRLVFFPTTRTQKRYPIIVKRRDEGTE